MVCLQTTKLACLLRGWTPKLLADGVNASELPGFNPELMEARTAKEWGLTPREWREEPFDDRALMLAYELFCSTREAYQQER